MRIDIDDHNYIVLDADNGVHVTRQTIMGGVATHKITSGTQNPLAIGNWIRRRTHSRDAPLIQDAFPDMKPEDREFLMTGITPARWALLYPKEEE